MSATSTGKHSNFHVGMWPKYEIMYDKFAFNVFNTKPHSDNNQFFMARSLHALNLVIFIGAF